MALKKSRFDWNSFLKMLFALAIPVALQNLFSTTATMIDTMMIGKIGTNEVAAVGLCTQFSELCFSCHWGFIGGGMLFFAQYWGANDHEGINHAYGLTFICVMSVGLLFSLLAICAPEFVMAMYTDKPALQAIGVRYLRIAGIGYALNLFSSVMVALLRSTERVKIPLFSGICSVVTNIVFNYLLIYGKLGFPRLTVQGAAIATVLSQVVNVGVILLLVKKKHLPFILEFRHHFTFKKEMVRQYLRKSAPILANEILIGVANMVISMVLGRQAEDAIAAVAVMRTLEGCMIGFFAGFSSAASVLVGKEIGAGHPEEAYRRAIRLVYVCMTIIACVGGLILLVHPPLLRAMGLRDQSFIICEQMLMVFCVVAVIRQGGFWIMNDTFRTSGDARFGATLEIVFMWAINIPLVILTGLVWHAPVLLVFACCYADELPRFILMQIRLYHGRWIKPVTPEGIAAMPEFRRAHHMKEKN